MRGTLVLLGAAVLAGILLNACAKPMYIRSEDRLTYYEAPNQSDDYIKKVAVAVKPAAPAQWGTEAGALLLASLLTTIRDEHPQWSLVAPGDPDYPGFMQIYRPISSRDAFAVAQTARRQGFHSLVQAGVENIRVDQKKTGIWWFRKDRRFLTVVLSLDVFDTFTGAKLSGKIMEETVQIDDSSYAAFQAGSLKEDEAITNLITDMAENLGEQAASVISAGKWIASVVEARNPHIYLSPGESAGLRVGDRLSIFEGRRIIEGQNGEKYIVPGHKVTDVRITSVDENTAEAAFEGPVDIRPGDIAVPGV